MNSSSSNQRLIDRLWVIPSTNRLFWIFISLALGIVLIGGPSFYASQARLARRSVEANLATMTQLKADQIIRCRKEKLVDANVMVDSPALTESVERWLASPDSAASERILVWFRAWQQSNHYHDVLLVDVTGQVRLSLLIEPPPLHPEIRKYLAESFTTRRPLLTDLYVSTGDLKPHLEVIVPIFSGSTKARPPIGALILRHQAADELFPLIKYWPAVNASAETVLVRREGESVLFLSELRHRPHTMLELRLPLAKQTAPAVQAALGWEGAFAGTDYRGVRVLANVRQIPHSPWALLAKIDEAEALADWSFRGKLIVGAISALAVVLGLLGLLVGHGQRRYRNLVESAAALQEANRAYRLLSECNQELVRATNEVSLLEAICQHIVTIGGYRLAWVGIAEQDEDKSVRPIAQAGFADDYLAQLKITWADSERGQGPAGTAIRTGRPVVYQNILTDPTMVQWREPARKRGYAAWAALPLRDPAGQAFGAVMIYATEPVAFAEDELKLLTELVNDAAFGIQLLRLGSEREKVTVALRESEARLQRAVAAGNVGLWEWNLETDAIYYSPEWKRQIGYADHEIAPTDEEWESRVHPDDLPGMLGKMQEYIDRPAQLYTHEFRFRHKDGSYRWILVRASIIQAGPGNERHMLGAHVDITDRKQAEEQLRESNQRLDAALTELRKTQRHLVQQEQLRGLGQMASGVAHDFNNALAPIVGFSEFLLKHPEKLADHEQVIKWLTNIHTCATDAALVVRRMREFGRQQLGNDTLSPVDLNQLVLQTIELTEPCWKDQAQASGRTIHVATDLQPVPSILGEEFAIRELLTNLVFNAVDALTTGGTLTLGTVLVEKSVCVWVSDTGIGMTAETRQRCFEPFFTTKTGAKGSGLGLALVHSIVERHGGTVAVESEPGRGATITIWLPLPTTEPVVAEAALAGDVVGPRALHVLVVDDEPALCEVVREWLLSHGHTVVTVANGSAALRQIQDGHFDLVITDQAMPDMNGEQLAGALHQQDSGLPVILMSGFGDLMKTTGGVPSHVVAIPSKPVTEAALREVLAQAFPRPAAGAAGRQGNPG